MRTLIVFIALLASFAHGAEISSEQAKAAAEVWLKSNFIAKQSLAGCEIEDISVRSALYVVRLSPNGYIILPNTDIVAPIVAFSANPFVEPEEDSPFFALLKASNEQAIAAEAKGGERHARWTKLIGTRDGLPIAKPMLAGTEIDTSEMTEYVAPFLTAHWNQWQPWNDFCPQLGEADDGAYRNRVPCGCVATAAAQLLYVWKWPYCDGEARIVTHSFKYDNTTEKIDLRYDGRVPFDWNSLVDTYSGFSGDSRGKVKESYRFPVARLVFWLDGALSMGYAQGGSGADLGAMSDELRPWYYSEERYSWSDYETFAEHCREELKAGAPVGIGVPGHQVVGHGWASDGEDDYIYLNYGWGGSSDGWYRTNADAPTTALNCVQCRRPRPKAQLEPLSAISPTSVTLKWHLPDFYKDKISGFTITKQPSGTTVGSFTENFSSYENGFVHWIPHYANELELTGTYGLTTRSVVELDASIKLGLDGTFSLMMKEGEGAWESIYDWAYSVGGTTESRKLRVFLGDRAGKSVKFKLVNKRTGGRYYNSENALLDFDGFKLTDVVLPQSSSSVSVSASAREYAFSDLIAGRMYSFTVTPKIDGAEVSNQVSTRIAGAYTDYLPGTETYAAKSYSYSTSNANWTIADSTYSSGTIATGVWSGKINYRIDGKVGSSTTLSFKWTANGAYSAGSAYDTLKVEFNDLDNNVTSLYSITNTAKQTTAKTVSVSLKSVQGKKGFVTISFGHTGGQINGGGMKFTEVKISNVMDAVLPKLASETRQSKTCDKPEILKVIGPDGTEFDEGFYRDLVNGEDYFDVEVSESTVELNAYPSHLYLLNDEQVSVTKLAPTKYRVTTRPAERAFNRTRLIMTLEAINANGDKTYKDLSLRFDAEEKILALDNKRTFNAFDCKPYKTYLFEGSTGMSGTADGYIDAPFGKAVIRTANGGPYTGITYNFADEFTVVTTARSANTDNSVIFNLGSSYDPYGLVLASGGTGKITLSHWTTANTAHKDLVTTTVSDAAAKFHTYVIRAKNKSVELWVDGVKKGTGTLSGYPTSGLQLFGIYSGTRNTGFTTATEVAMDELYIYQSAIPDAMIVEYSNLRKTSDSTYASFVTSKGWEMPKNWVTKFFPNEKYYLARVNREAANGRRIWECYEAGLDPTDEKAEFNISFELVDGKPVLKVDPDLGTARTYKFYGSKDLTTWTEVSAGNEDDYNFFKVTVEMK